MLVAGAFGCRFRLGHSLRHLRFDGVEVEARASLHRRVLEEGLEFLTHYLLNEHETPELIHEPITEVKLRTLFRPVVGYARALEGIDPQVGDVRHVRMGFLTNPAGRLVDEAELVIVDTYRTDRAFAKIKDFVARGWAFAGDGGHLVVAVQMVLVGPVTDRFTFQQLVGDVRITGCGNECRQPVQAGEDAVLDGVRRHMTGPASETGHAEAAFEDRSLGLRERRLPAIGPGKDFGTVIGGEDDNGVLILANVLQLFYHPTPAVTT